MMGSGSKGREGLWPRPTPGLWCHPGASLNLKVLIATPNITVLPPWAVVRWKRGQLRAHLLVAELTESSEDRYG